MGLQMSVIKLKSKRSLQPIIKDTDNKANQSKLEVHACSIADAKREKTVRVRRDWFRFYFCLDEKVGRDF